MSMADRDGVIWYDGKFVPWRDANTHVLTHTLHYGMGVFEGVLLESGVPYEFRTTVHPLFHTPESLLRLAEELRALGARHYVLQEFRPQGCADGAVSAHSARELLDEALCSRIGAMFATFSVRRT